MAGSLGFGGHREHLVLDYYHRLAQTVFMDQQKNNQKKKKNKKNKQAAVVALVPAAAAVLINAVLPPKRTANSKGHRCHT